MSWKPTRLPPGRGSHHSATVTVNGVLHTKIEVEVCRQDWHCHGICSRLYDCTRISWALLDGNEIFRPLSVDGRVTLTVLLFGIALLDFDRQTQAYMHPSVCVWYPHFAVVHCWSQYAVGPVAVVYGRLVASQRLAVPYMM